MKSNNKRRKAAITTMIAAGMTTGALTACAGADARNETQPKPGVELTAADKVVIDGEEVQMEAPNRPDSVGHVAQPMYGVRRDPIRLLYGPRPRPGIDRNNGSQMAVLETQVIQVVASALNLDPENVTPESKLVDDLGITPRQTQNLKATLESKFDVVIQDDTMNAMRTVADLIDCIRILKL